MKSLTHCAYEVMVLICVLFTVHDAIGVHEEYVGSKYFMGYRRAPLPYPYQLVLRKGRVSLCDYKGCTPVLDVDSIGYDEEYVYAMSASGSFSLLHLYDAYVEKYESESFLSESIHTRTTSGLVKMINARRLVDSFQKNNIQTNRSFYVRREIYNDIYGKAPAVSPFLPVDVKVIVEMTTNGVPQRIVREFQNRSFTKAVISRIECERVAASKVYFRMVGNGQGKKLYRGWTVLPMLTYPIEIPEGGKFEICVERENAIPDNCFIQSASRNITVKINALDGGGSMLRIGTEVADDF